MINITPTRFKISPFFLIDSFIVTVENSIGNEDRYYRDLTSPALLPQLDLSTYPRNHPIYQVNKDVPNFVKMIQANKQKLGCYKDETPLSSLQNLICLRPKLYCFKSIAIDSWNDDQTFNPKKEEVKTTIACKGVDKNTQKTKLSFDLYQSVFDSELPLRHDNISIRSYDHQLYIVKTNKTSLSLYEDKRWWKDKYTSYPFSHPACDVNSIEHDHCYC